MSVPGDADAESGGQLRPAPVDGQLVRAVRTYCAVLLPADARRVGHQRERDARELSGLPFPRAEPDPGSGELRAFDLGPLGITAMIDEGKVANARGDLGFSHLKH